MPLTGSQLCEPSSVVWRVRHSLHLKDPVIMKMNNSKMEEVYFMTLTVPERYTE